MYFDVLKRLRVSHEFYGQTDGLSDGRTDGRTEQLLAIAPSKTEDLCAKPDYVKNLQCCEISLKSVPILGYGAKTKINMKDSRFCLKQDGWIKSNISVVKCRLRSLVCAMLQFVIKGYLCVQNIPATCLFYCIFQNHLFNRMFTFDAIMWGYLQAKSAGVKIYTKYDNVLGSCAEVLSYNVQSRGLAIRLYVTALCGNALKKYKTPKAIARVDEWK